MGHDKCVRRMRPEDRRSAILDAALTVFAESGFGPATLNGVAERAGVTKGCVYHHFESKEQLLLTLLRERFASSRADPETTESESGSDATAEPLPPHSRADAVRGLVDQLWAHFQRPGQLELTTLAITELPKAPEIARALFDDVACRGRASMCDALRAIVRGPELDEGVDDTNDTDATTLDPALEAAARILPSMIMGAALGQRMFGAIDQKPLSPDDVKRALGEILLRGV